MKKIFVTLMMSAFSYLNAALTDIDILGTSNLLKETKTTVTVEKSDGTNVDMEITKGFPAGFAEALMAIHSGYLAKWRERCCSDISDLLLLFPESNTTAGQYALIVNKLHRDLEQAVNLIWGRVSLDMLPEMMAYNILNKCRVFYEEQTLGVENHQNFDDNYEYLKNLIIKKVQKLCDRPKNDDLKDKFVKWLKNSFIEDSFTWEFLNSFPVLHQKLLHTDPNQHFESPIKGTNQGRDAPTDLLINLFPLVVGGTLNTNVNLSKNLGMAFSKMKVEEKADFVALLLSSCQNLRNKLRFLDNLPEKLRKKIPINDILEIALKNPKSFDESKQDSKESGKSKQGSPKSDKFKIESIHEVIKSGMDKQNVNTLKTGLTDLFKYIFYISFEKPAKELAESEESDSKDKDGSKDKSDGKDIIKKFLPIFREVNKLVMKSVVYELTTFDESKPDKPPLLYPRGTTEMLIFAFCCHVFNGGDQNNNGDVSVLLKAMHKRGLIATDHVSLAIVHDEAVNKSQEEINRYQKEVTTIKSQLKSGDEDFVKNTERDHPNLEDELKKLKQKCNEADKKRKTAQDEYDQFLIRNIEGFEMHHSSFSVINWILKDTASETIRNKYQVLEQNLNNANNELKIAKDNLNEIDQIKKRYDLIKDLVYNRDKCEKMIKAYSSLIAAFNPIDLNNPKNFKRSAYIYQNYIDLRIKSINEIIKTFNNKEIKNKQIQCLTDKEGISLEDLLVYYDVKSDVPVPYGDRCIFESNENVTVEYQGMTYKYPDCVETTIRQLMTIFSNYDEKNDKIVPIDGWREEVKQFFDNDCPQKGLVNSKNLTVHNKWATVCQSVSYTNKGIEEDKQAGWRGKDGDLCSGWRNVIFMLNYLTQSNLTIPNEVSADQAVQFLQTISEHCRKYVVFQFEKEDEENVRCTLTPKNSTKLESEIKPFKFRIYAGSGHACLKPFDSSNDNSNVTLKINSDYDIFYGKYLSNTAVEQRDSSYLYGLKFQNQNMHNCYHCFAEFKYKGYIVSASRRLYSTALWQFNRNLFIQSSNLNSTSDSIKQQYFEVLKKEIDVNPCYKEKECDILFPDQSLKDRNDIETLKVMDTLVLLSRDNETLFEKVKNSCMNKYDQLPEITISRQLNFDPNNQEYKTTIENFAKTGFGKIGWNDFNKTLGY